MSFEPWMIPLVFSIVVYAWALLTPGYNWMDWQSGPDLLPTLRFGLATIWSLAAWLAWALLLR